MGDLGRLWGSKAAGPVLHRDYTPAAGVRHPKSPIFAPCPLPNRRLAGLGSAVRPGMRPVPLGTLGHAETLQEFAPQFEVGPCTPEEAQLAY